MIKVYWTEKNSQIMFLIYIPAYQFVIKSMGFLPGNKRRRSLRSKFLRPRLIELETGIKPEGLPSFEITGEELVKWIGRVSLDKVPSLEDIIMKVKKDIGAEIKKKE